MKISVIGSGYVGLCTAVGFASLGHNVTCVDIDVTKVEKINKGQAPIFEKGIEEALSRAVSKKPLKATDDTNTIINTDITFIAVGTPSLDDGSINLSYIKKSAEDTGKALKNKKKSIDAQSASDGYHLVVVKSTVLPETTEKIVIPLLEKSSGKKAGRDFGVCMNPEFLREGSALEDFLNPNRIVIGEYDKKSGDVMEKLCKDFKAPVIRTSLKTAEMIKYASNAFLATKISFINEIGNICKLLEIDTNEVARAMGYDKRISPHFLESGVGFGGSCFSKDISAIIAKSKELGYEPGMLQSVTNVNKKQPLRIVELLGKSIKNKKIAVLGLAFKPGTDDIRDSPAIPVIKRLLEMKADIYAYDPKAMKNMKAVFSSINYCNSAKEALDDADACLILTGWTEFKSLSDKDFSAMKKRIIIEGRKALDRKKVSGADGICW